ncbi:hypothetical protein [Portibacter lacus]|uniref:Uncharacterized protein n=1 Tax=Portibacter lacus TaxID=1099794 RepID=A0AA37WEU3_9BACT|nr:hypothetical protein [Portibacter lacus]GLR17742.1 hypothetical protein GCM10007940_23570 [Portibacter lacus]
MKKIILSLAFILVSLSQSSLLATNPISVEAFTEMQLAKDDIHGERLWVKAKTWLVKKWLKIGKKDSANGLSNLSVILGLASLAALITFFAGGTALELLLTFATLAALIGIIMSIIVLQKTKKDKSSYKKERRKAWWGLVLSSVTILSLLVVFALIILVLLAFF